MVPGATLQTHAKHDLFVTVTGKVLLITAITGMQSSTSVIYCGIVQYDLALYRMQRS